MDERWALPERFVARRASPHGPGWEVLVKWAGLGYEAATWEVRLSLGVGEGLGGWEVRLSGMDGGWVGWDGRYGTPCSPVHLLLSALPLLFHTHSPPPRPAPLSPFPPQSEFEPFMQAPEARALHRDMWQRFAAAMARAEPAAVEAGKSARIAARTAMPQVRPALLCAACCAVLRAASVSCGRSCILLQVMFAKRSSSLPDVAGGRDTLVRARRRAALAPAGGEWAEARGASWVPPASAPPGRPGWLQRNSGSCLPLDGVAVVEHRNCSLTSHRPNLPFPRLTDPDASRTTFPRPDQAVNWLRRQWSEGNNAVLADEQGLGKSASVLAFLQSLRADFSCPGPVLLVAPAASLPFWEGMWVCGGGGRVGGRPLLPGASADGGHRCQPARLGRCVWEDWVGSVGVLTGRQGARRAWLAGGCIILAQPAASPHTIPYPTLPRHLTHPCPTHPQASLPSGWALLWTCFPTTGLWPPVLSCTTTSCGCTQAAWRGGACRAPRSPSGCAALGLGPGSWFG